MTGLPASHTAIGECRSGACLHKQRWTALPPAMPLSSMPIPGARQPPIRVASTARCATRPCVTRWLATRWRCRHERCLTGTVTGADGQTAPVQRLRAPLSPALGRRREGVVLCRVRGPAVHRRTQSQDCPEHYHAHPHGSLPVRQKASMSSTSATSPP